MAEELKNIDFKRGIVSDDIQHNFEVIQNAIREQRLTVSGYGVFEGLKLKDDDGKIRIEKGRVVSADGALIDIEEQELELPSLEEEVVTDEERPVGDDGRVTLDNRPVDILEIAVHGEDQIVELPVPTEGNTVILDTDYTGLRVDVQYTTVYSQVFLVYVDEQGQAGFSEGISSTSPSLVDTGQYEDKIILGSAELRYDADSDKGELEIDNSLKQYRAVHVGEDNTLYIYGRPFAGAQIYYEEPEPEEDIFWYDRDTNQFMAYSEAMGGVWVPVNDLSPQPFTEVKMWDPEKEDYPEDNRTFMFEDSDIDMFFTPGCNQLQVLIDNNIVMRDQLEEIVEKDDAGFDVGKGFALKRPLDKKSFVECRVTHNARRAHGRRAFQRSAVFVKNGREISDGEERVFATVFPYLAGEEQLEVFVNGVRLDRLAPNESGEGFYEYRTSSSRAGSGEKGVRCNYFRIANRVSLQTGDVVSHKVSFYAYSYDHLNELLYRYEERLSELESLVDEMKTFTGDPREYIRKGEDLASEDIPPVIKDRLQGAHFHLAKDSDEEVLLEGVSEDDFIMVFSGDQVLEKDTDYSIEQETDGVVLIPASPDLHDILYIAGIKRGY